LVLSAKKEEKGEKRNWIQHEFVYHNDEPGNTILLMLIEMWNYSFYQGYLDFNNLVQNFFL
jgi:hypothetical protein